MYSVVFFWINISHSHLHTLRVGAQAGVAQKLPHFLPEGAFGARVGRVQFHHVEAEFLAHQVRCRGFSHAGGPRKQGGLEERPVVVLVVETRPCQLLAPTVVALPVPQPQQQLLGIAPVALLADDVLERGGFVFIHPHESGAARGQVCKFREFNLKFCKTANSIYIQGWPKKKHSVRNLLISQKLLNLWSSNFDPIIYLFSLMFRKIFKIILWAVYF